MKNKSSDKISLAIYLASIHAWISFILMIIFYYLLASFCFGFWILFDIRRMHKGYHRFARGWGRSSLALIPYWKYKVRGLSKIDRSKHYVIVANHQSLLDILLCLIALPIDFRFIAKKELFKVPFLGWYMAAAGYIPVMRNNSSSRKDAILKSRDCLTHHTSILMFPEGTRSPDGQIQEFKPGAFKLALAKGVALLPVVIEGTVDAMPKKSWTIYLNRVFRCHILKPVPLKESDNITEVIEKTRADMIDHLAKMRAHKVK